MLVLLLFSSSSSSSPYYYYYYRTRCIDKVGFVDTGYHYVCFFK